MMSRMHRTDSASANWFVALPVAAAGWFDRLVPHPPEGLQRFHPEDLHLTIAFLGRVGEEAARAGFAAVHWPLPAMRATLGRVVPMGNERRYSALSALLAQGREAVEAAMSQTRGAAFTAAGAPPELRPARAHLTLARPQRRATGAQRGAGLRWAAGLALEEVGVQLDRVALYTWAEERATRKFRLVDVRVLPPAGDPRDPGVG